MRNDWENIKDGDRLVIYPNSENPLYKKAGNFFFTDGCYFHETNYVEGPDYYFRDVARYNHGFDIVGSYR